MMTKHAWVSRAAMRSSSLLLDLFSPLFLVSSIPPSLTLSSAAATFDSMNETTTCVSHLAADDEDDEACLGAMCCNAIFRTSPKIERKPHTSSRERGGAGTFSNVRNSTSEEEEEDSDEEVGADRRAEDPSGSGGRGAEAGGGAREDDEGSDGG